MDKCVLENAINAYKMMAEIEDDTDNILDKVTLSFLEELKQYRDLEEQGLLLKPPVAVGAKVYEIIEDPIPNHRFYIDEYEVQDVSAKAVKYCDDWIEYDCPNLYFNKSEAEAKLKELRNRNEKQ